MARSTKKGAFVDGYLQGRIEAMNSRNEKKVLRTWSRRSTIIPEFVGHTIAVHNGKKFIPVYITKKRVAATVEKLLRSAVENANYLSSEKNIDVDVDKLYVKQAVANDGPRMKRIRPAPMGRAYRYVRRIAHIELVLAEKGANNGAVASVAGEEAGVAKTAKAKRRVPAKRIKRKKTARAR